MNHESMQDQLQALQNKIARLERESAKAAPRKKQSRLARIAIAAAMFLIPVVAFGVTITKPYTFVSGQPISASELNANFDTVYDRVNELGMYKVKVGSTVYGDVLAVASGKQAYFITEEGYVSLAGETAQNTIIFGVPNGYTYHNLSDCSDTGVLTFPATKTVLNIGVHPTVNLVYGTGTLPTSVPGYLKSFGNCFPNASAGTQTTADFTTFAANDESITGVPNSATGAFSIVLE